jgi:hypothetical protein
MGEDPTLMSKMVVQMVTGAQNNSVGEATGPDGRTLRSGMCCKHFAGSIDWALVAIQLQCFHLSVPLATSQRRLQS